MGIIVTEAANNKMIDKFHKDFLRLSLSDGGCNGYQYYWDIAETPSDNDYIIGKLVVDVNSMTYLKGSTIDCKETLVETGFKIHNPNEVSSCGCGVSIGF